jgi:signal transduction histidine kinase
MIKSGQRLAIGCFAVLVAATIATFCFGAQAVPTMRPGQSYVLPFVEAVAHTIGWTPWTPAFIAAAVCRILAACAMTIAALLPLTRLPEATKLTRRLTLCITAVAIVSHLAPLLYPLALVRPSGVDDASYMHAVFTNLAWMISGFGVIIVLHLCFAEREARQRAEELSRAKLEAAEALADARAQIIRWGFHELRVPFNTLHLGLQELQGESAGLPPSTADTLTFMSDAAAAMQRILDDVLLMQKAEAGKLALVLEPTSLAAVASTAVRRALPFARDRGVELSLQLLSVSGVAVLADPQRLSQVLSNLLRSVHPRLPGCGRRLVPWL